MRMLSSFLASVNSSQYGVFFALFFRSRAGVSNALGDREKTALLHFFKLSGR